jgi:hypothetical protein
MSISVYQVKRLWPWLVEARFLWLALGLIVTALVVALRPNTPEPVIRITGLILQLFGIYTIIWGISETRKLFEHPSFAAKTKSWFERFPLRQRDINVVSGVASFVTIGCKASGYSTSDPGPNPTIEKRLVALERNISRIHDRISDNEKEVDDEFRKTAEALKNEEQTRQTEDNSIHKKLETTGTGGVHISAIGASCLFVGVILSTASVEIAKFLK